MHFRCENCMAFELYLSKVVKYYDCMSENFNIINVTCIYPQY